MRRWTGSACASSPAKLRFLTNTILPSGENSVLCCVSGCTAQTVSGRGIRLSTDELIDVGNLDENGDIHAADDPRRAFHKGNLLWHSDVTFDPVRATYSLLAAHIVPPDGGDTEFADMKAAYVDLSEDVKQRIEGLTAEHSIWYSRRLGGMDDVGDDAKQPGRRHTIRW